MKLLLVLALTLSSLSFAEPVFECIDGTRYFKVFQNQDGTLWGNLKAFDYGPGKSGHVITRYSCQRRRAGIQNFVCRRGEYIVNAHRTRGERGSVSVELTGDFGMDSGYLYTLYCGR